jgi:hypothetical protein
VAAEKGGVAMGVPLAAGYFANKEASKPGGKKNAPAPPDYMGLVREQGDIQRRYLEEQTRANRPNQSTPFASSQWTRGPDGQWQQNVSLSGGLGEAGNALQNQVAEQLRQPLDMSTLPELGSGEEAAARARDAVYNQARSRLDPQWAAQEESNRTRLLNQGLTEGSEAYNRAMDRLANQRTDAYNQANFSSIREGEAVGQARFGQNMAARNQALMEMLRQRQLPLSELAQLQGFTAMPGFSQAGQAQAPDLLNAGGMQGEADFRNWQGRNQAQADFWNSIMQLGGTLGAAAVSDERAKTDLRRLPAEAAPGVPLAVFRYRPGMGPPGLYKGVVAQDLQKVLPEAVHEGEGGVLYVSGEFAPKKIGD